MTDFGLRNKIADIIATDIMDFEVAYDATDAILAMPEISNAQAKIAELENALAAASGTIEAMRDGVATDQDRIAELKAALRPFASHVDKSSCEITMVWRDGDYVSTYSDTLKPSDFWATTMALKPKP